MDWAFILEIMVVECGHCTRKNYFFHDRNDDSSKELGDSSKSILRLWILVIPLHHQR